MKLAIDDTRLQELLKAEEKLDHLDCVGVDNWDGYEDALDEYDPDAHIDMTGFGDFGKQSKKYYRDQKLFYNDNPCRFVAYLSSEIVIVVVSLKPDLDDLHGGNWCTPCNIGGKESHTCYEYDDVIEHLKDTLTETVIPLVVNENLLTERPVVIVAHEKEVAKITEQAAAKKAEIKKLVVMSAALEGDIARQKKEIELLKELLGVSNAE